MRFRIASGIAALACACTPASPPTRPTPPPSPVAERPTPSLPPIPTPTLPPTTPNHSAPRAEPQSRYTSFRSAKKAAHEVYENTRTSFYCGCRFDENLSVDHQSCGYTPKRDSNRANRIEWEHIVPAHTFGHGFTEWIDGSAQCVTRRGKHYAGRRCARKTRIEFRRMESDLYNLVPAIGEVNARRSNYPMAMIPGEPREYGACDIEIQGRTVEPRPSIRGDIARIYMYMNSAYPDRGIVGDANRALFRTWSKSDPVDVTECARTRAVSTIQGNANPFVEPACRDLNTAE